MKYLPLIFILLGASAWADESPQAINWIKLQAMTSGQTQQERGERLRELGLSDSAAAAVVDYVERGNQAINDEGKATGVAFCKRRGELENDREAFAKAVEASDARRQAIYKGLIDNLPVLLPHDAAVVVLAELEHGDNNVTIFETKVPEHVRAGDIDLKRVFDVMCRGAE